MSWRNSFCGGSIALWTALVFVQSHTHTPCMALAPAAWSGLARNAQRAYRRRRFPSYLQAARFKPKHGRL
jgi:hypothetical protein